MLALLYAAAYVDVQPEHAWTLEHGSEEIARVLEDRVDMNLAAASRSVRLSPLSFPS